MDQSGMEVDVLVNCVLERSVLGADSLEFIRASTGLGVEGFSSMNPGEGLNFLFPESEPTRDLRTAAVLGWLWPHRSKDVLRTIPRSNCYNVSMGIQPMPHP